MKVLNKVSLREMLKFRATCPKCLGRGYQFVILGQLDAKKYCMVYPCSCVRQLVRIEED